jgi:hypothetical protein
VEIKHAFADTTKTELDIGFLSDLCSVQFLLIAYLVGNDETVGECRELYT